MLFLFNEIEPRKPLNPRNIQLTSSGLSSEKYPGSLGEYQVLQDRDHNGHPVYQNLNRKDRYIIYIGNIKI